MSKSSKRYGVPHRVIATLVPLALCAVVGYGVFDLFVSLIPRATWPN